MQKNLFILLRRALERRLRPNSHWLDFKILCCCTILIPAFPVSPLEANGNPNINGEIAFNSQVSEILAAHQEARELKPGETIEREMKAEETQSYKISLEAGQSVTVTIAKHSMAIAVKTFTPDGEEYAHHQRGGKAIFEPTVIVAEKTGDYRVTVRSFWSGTYSISSDMPRKPTEKDRKYLAAQKLYLSFLKLLRETSNGRDQKILETLEERLAIYRSLDDPRLVAVTLSDLASQYRYMGEYSKMIDCYNEIIAILQPLENFIDVIDALSALSNDAMQRRGDYQKAIDLANQKLSLSRSKLSRNDEASALHSLGVIYHLLADEQKALEFYEQSLAVRQSINEPNLLYAVNEAITLSNIGNLYRGIGASEKILDYFNPRTATDRKKAIAYYLRALEIYRSNKYTLGEAGSLHQIGNTYKELGNYSEAVNYLEKSLAFYKDQKNLRGQSNVLRSIGNLYSLKGEYQKGAEYYEQTTALLRTGIDNQNQAEFLIGIAKDYYAGGETQKALDLYSEALTISRLREQQVVSAASLYEIARIERDLGNFNNARNKIEEAIQVVESIRAKIFNQEIRATYFATVKRYYDFYIDLLMQAHKSQPEKGFDLLALQTSEKSRSRSLVDLLSQAKIDIKQGVDAKLLEREQQARERLSDKAYQQNRLLLGKHTKEEAEKIAAEIAALTNEYRAVQAEIRNESPRFASLTQPTSLNAKQIHQLLDPGTILLEYSLGEKKSYLWAVSPDSIKSFDLPPREEIETQARKVYELLVARNQNLNNETPQQRRTRIAAADKEYPKAAETLSRMLLSPVAAEIGNKRLLVVADGALNYLPFSVLPSPTNDVGKDLRSPLGVNHEIVNLPSASVLALLRQEAGGRKPAPKMLAVYADPVFNRDDARLSSKAKSSRRDDETLASISKTENLNLNRDVHRAAADVGLVSREAGSGLPRLVFSRREADSIFNVSPKNLSLRAVDFKASKAEVISTGIDQYRILHFATHGLLDSQRPELSGVVLSLVNEKGTEQDGFLRLQDIYNLKLSADLVVLSACNTALGKDVKGEGLVGLTRGFMYAGSPRVIASLWKVDDAATAELMAQFYKKLLVENLRPAAALRAAQLEMIKQERWRSPYYWAPFIIQGEWR